MIYLIKPRVKIYVEGCGFLSLARNMDKSLSTVSMDKSFLTGQKSQQQMHLKLPQKGPSKKQQKQ